MPLRVHNTLSGEREEFEPVTEGTVLLYLCGLTTSDPAHLGHARTWVHTDIMDRWLTYSGYSVTHVENFTDVNEKIVARVGADGEDESAVAENYVANFIRDMRSLNLRRATVYPRVTEHIPEIIDLIETLIEKGYAYESNESVYFDVQAFEDYGTLSNQDLDQIESQGDPAEREEKQNPTDFALWKAGGVDIDEIEKHRFADAAPASAACETAMTWDSPWGEGRPGWHIECSAMSITHLDTTFDIHVAGEDLVFPHNENEIAQAQAATGDQFANYWLHVGLLETEGEKMSSSLRNYFTVEHAIEEFGVDVIRTFLLSATYSEKQTYSEATLVEATERYDRLERGYERAVNLADSPQSLATVEDETLRTAIQDAREVFERAMNDDFNTRKALSALVTLTTAVFAHEESHDQYDYQALRRAIETFEELGGEVLGLTFGTEPASSVDIVHDLADLVLDVREAEREAGNYERADELRDNLEDLGLEVQDTEDGPAVRFD